MTALKNKGLQIKCSVQIVFVVTKILYDLCLNVVCMIFFIKPFLQTH